MNILDFSWFAALLPLMVFNRIRGGGMSSMTDRLPGRALYYVGAIVGSLTAALLDPLLGLIVGIGFIFWGAPGWGLWFDLHRHDEEQKHDRRHEDLFVRVMNAVSFGSDHVAMFLRLSLFLLPMLAAWCYLTDTSYWLLMTAALFGALGVGCYALRWRSTWGNTLSEMLIGLQWWGLIGTMNVAAHSSG